MATETGVAEKAAASELGEHRWGIMSERGCEATRLDYDGAARLVRRLKGEGVRGLCVVTETAASHLAPAKTHDAKATDAKTHSGNGSKRPRREAKK
ncbi:MAG TPA: hypothetical protein VF064_16585 [Pyrinomonadaceae bacterium]